MDKLSLISYQLVFNRKGRLKKNGTAPITVRCYQNSIQKHIPTGICIEPKYWDKKRQTVRTRHQDAFILNNRLQEQLLKMRAYEKRIIDCYESCHVGQISNYTDFRANQTSFTDFYEQELNTPKLSPNSIRTRRVTLKKLLKFNRGNKVYFDNLNYSFIKRFDTWLHRHGLGQNTINKQHKHVIMYINLAIKHDLFKMDKNPYKKFSLKMVDVEKISLTEEELQRIEALDLEVDSLLYKVRDAFLFSCYVGLRYSDYSRVSKMNIDTVKEGLTLRIQAVKTKKYITYPLYALFKEGNSSKPEMIVQKYLDRDFYKITNQFDDLPFFKVSNQAANRSLKEIAKLAKIRKTLTTHVGRKTFATLAAMRVPLPLLQRLMQHASPKETMRYVDNNPQLLAKQLDKIDWS